MQTRPNILLIMADQFRTASMTGLGDGIETPNIDRIRENGLFFSKAACTAPLCVPSRASLATGKYPHRCGVTAENDDLPLDETTYYQRLRRGGYRVALVGKTDLHKSSFFVGRRGDLPIIQHIGFTDPCETEGKMNSARLTRDETGRICPNGPYQAYLEQKNPALLEAYNAAFMHYMFDSSIYHVEPSVLDGEDFLDAFVGRQACSFLRTVGSEAPWHLLASFAGPHNPWDPPAEELEALGDRALSLPPWDDLSGKPAWIRARAASQSAGLTPQALLHTKRHYAAAIRVIDRYVGEMLDVLEVRGLLENTVVIFTADHGELMGEHGLFEKRAMYEGALRVPLVIRTPEMRGAAESRELALLMDLAPTILELCGVDYDRADMDARSLLPVLRGGTEPLRTVQKSELVNTYMLCDGRYKWIRSPNDTDELYDLDTDPDELQNCIREHPNVVQAMRRHSFR